MHFYNRAIQLGCLGALVAACGGAATPAAEAPPMTSSSQQEAPSSKTAAEPAAAKTPDFKLTETPSDKLGTVPPGLGLAVGTKAPAVTLVDVTGQSTALGDLYARGPTLVVFYRGGWCPFCNLQLHELSKEKPEFDKRGVKLVAISVDKPSEEAKTQAKNEVLFPMLSDPKLVAHKAFKVVHVVGEVEQTKLTQFGVDITSYSGETHKSFAVPATFLIDRQGVVRFVHVEEDYKTRPSAKQLLQVIDKTR